MVSVKGTERKSTGLSPGAGTGEALLPLPALIYYILTSTTLFDLGKTAAAFALLRRSAPLTHTTHSMSLGFLKKLNWDTTHSWEIIETSRQVHSGNYEPFEY